MKYQDPSQFKAPHFKFDDIRIKADQFRETYWQTNQIPVDIFFIIEEKLKLNIVPIEGFKSNSDIEALLYDGGRSIAVDKTEYMDDRYLNRLRYSVAHEVAHLVIHKELYDLFDYDTVDKWIETLDALPEEEYNWIEQQANEFAGRLLVPVDKLIEALNSIQPKIILFRKSFPDTENSLLKEYVASLVCKKFGVSESVISKRIDKEKLIHLF